MWNNNGKVFYRSDGISVTQPTESKHGRKQPQNKIACKNIRNTEPNDMISQDDITTTTLHPFNHLFSMATWVSRHQESKQFWILLEQEMTGWQWHHMQIICTLLQTDNHASTSPLSFTDRMPFLPPNEQRQSTEGMKLTLLEAKNASTDHADFSVKDHRRRKSAVSRQQTVMHRQSMVRPATVRRRPCR